MSSIDTSGNRGATYVGFSPQNPALPGVIPPSVQGPTPSGIGQLGGSALTGITSASVTNNAIGGDVRIGGPILLSSDPMTMGDQAALNQLKVFENIPASAVSNNPRESMSLNDMVAELTMMMLQHAMANKSIERAMKAELAVTQFQNGMKMAEMIEQKGKLAFEKAVVESVTKLASALVDIAATKIAEKAKAKETEQKITSNSLDSTEDKLAAQQVANDVDGKVTETQATKPNFAGYAADKTEKVPLSEAQKKAIDDKASLIKEVVKATIDCTGVLVAAHLDLGMSKIDAEKQAMKTLNKLMDSVTSSVDSSIHSAEQSIQFALDFLKQINSMAHEAAQAIINNSR
jgi:hypothetical protein